MQITDKMVYEFDRYINGTLMAEGVTIERQADPSSAMREGARIAPRGPNGEVPVLVLRSPSPAQEAGAEPVAWLHENPKFGPKLTFQRDVAGFEERYGWTKTPLYASPTPIQAVDWEKAVEREWQALLDKDDRTSPEEYPDMVLISRDELANAIRALSDKGGSGR